ncbi:tetratricopeptide repeat protein [Furfurilactobacillus milii]|uniref:Tetratricopeptide repeat protein n=1 Tax=Furfurilactobacillus milii TaxID=2888272 RepID=A0ABT6D724_9LACO|nr:tetratricopeptide repeat protein [Furfurilactobacillus milii]QLE66515.1 TPR-repeat-containing protein component of Menaquinone-cytochrome C reductase [Furfurilactobacillus rossiae]MCF6159968.1 tetratricopeptide repeat protein [Furfurilactobacillus milii]MCF6162483.1 tetratricopeptide repeat protein [Furfurilactobacillus milii]MCF6419346.1 tetratricopeptide repeat protein [Furfurilactobacillus milii]MDF9912930.1 tetratricopeptide repeat protein [Furfurilactobacillus milii]
MSETNSYSVQMLDALQSGQVDKSNKLFAWALRKDDDDTLYNLAEQLYGLGFNKKAQRIYEKLLKEYPDEDELRTSLADIAIDEGDTDAATNYLDAVSPDSDAYLQSLLVAADLYQSEELFEVSEQKLLTAEKIAPDEPVVLFALGEFYFMMREYQKSINYYLDLIKRGIPKMEDVDLVSRIGVAYANSGKFEQAVGYLEQIHTADMTPDVRFQLGFVYTQLKDNQKAIHTFEQLHDEDPSYSSLYPYLARALSDDNQVEAAYKVAQEGLGVDEYNQDLFGLAANLALKLQENGAAEDYLKRGLALDPDNQTLMIQLSNLYVQAHHDVANVDLATQYVQRDQVDPQVYWNLAVSYVRLEKNEEAQTYYDAARPYFEDNPDFLKPAFFFYREQGQPEVAVNLLRNYLKLQPEDEEMVAALEDYEDQGY